jgi:molecular chaperone HscB
MTPDPIPVRAASMLECRNCGAGAPVDEHFCQQCSRILALGRHGDYFSFCGLPRRLGLDLQDLERRFRDLSRKFHPDYFYNAPPAERLASLERSSYLNDAYRTLRNPAARIEHLLAVEGLPPATADQGGAKVPPALLEEVFALNEELDEIRELRESGGDEVTIRTRLEAARRPIEGKRDEHGRRIQELGSRWDSQAAASSDERLATLQALREQLLESKYIDNLLATIARETAGSGPPAPGSGQPEAESQDPEVRSPGPKA